MQFADTAQTIRFGIFNESTQEFYATLLHSRNGARAEAEYLACFTEQPHSVWETEDSGATYINTGDIYDGSITTPAV